jgi:predicted dehydrogenase
MAEEAHEGRTLKVGIIGVGGMGSQHCRNIVSQVPQMKLTAVCDTDAAQARKVGEEVGVRSFTAHADLLRHGGCQAAVIATPHPSHAAIAEDCFAAGLHVLTEKPLAETVSAADRMIEAARRSRRVLGVVFQMRFIPSCRKAIEVVRRGELGRLLGATLISPHYRTQAYYEAGQWRATWVGEGGGVLLNQAPHIMDLFLSLAGMPNWVWGFTGTVMHDIEVEDCAQALLRFPGGGVGYLYTSTIEPGPGEGIQVFGENGKIIYRDGKAKYYRFSSPVSDFTRTTTEMWGKLECREVPLDAEDRGGGHVDVMRNFANHILNGEELVCAGDTGIRQVELANAIILSGRTGKPVDLPLNRQAYDQLLANLRQTSRYSTKGDQVKRITDPTFMRR